MTQPNESNAATVRLRERQRFARGEIRRLVKLRYGVRGEALDVIDKTIAAIRQVAFLDENNESCHPDDLQREYEASR